MKNSDDSQDDVILEQQVKKFQKELNAGTVALMLLSIIGQANRALYGYEIGKHLQQSNDVKQGAIYPVLRNLHGKGLIFCETKHSESGPARKYYSITTLGQKVLGQWLLSWQSTQQQVNKILDGSEDNE